ncbi:MAG: hypothetical protein LUE91_06220, partial [Oscillospiraceae bacterium]|nr:hypothetical protein [Oscillospiraceae bacterium]
MFFHKTGYYGHTTKDYRGNRYVHKRGTPGKGPVCQEKGAECPALAGADVRAEYFIRLLLGGMLAGAELFDGCAPFALGLAAASG